MLNPMSRAVYIRDVARAVGMTPQAVRYYERLKLVEPARRTDSGYRVYGPDAIERVRFIKQAQRLGLSLDEIREVLRLKYSGQSPCDCVRGMLNRKLAELKSQIAEMETLRGEIATCLRATRRLTRLPHEASLICPVIQIKVASRRNPKRERR